STSERVPEPTSILGILALGALGISSLLKHKLKQQKQAKQ
ncbi:MAG: PEP-CTERM sorting domain-containing protein, partial [Moorea sp. SIO2I5]|nr:PEP-CTERM sorting domain-containing protein [Moorena sp. SIO2I5]